jgi:Protein of unknown function (DUF1353)
MAADAASGGQDKRSFMEVALRHTKDFEGKPAPVVPFADWDYYYTKETIKWHSNEDPPLRVVTVPIGFVTDLASVPRLFWLLFPPAARYSYPAIIHDYLYWYQPFDRSAADDVLKEAMHDLTVPIEKILTVYTAVRAAGGKAWESNAAARANGEHRVLRKFPTDYTTTWSSWRQQSDVFLS